MMAGSSTDSQDDLAALEALLGYPFRDRALLSKALRHTSWCNEQQGPQRQRPHVERANDRLERIEDNERLEFLGDAVLDLVVGHRLMEAYPQLREGELSVTRAQVVSEAGLSDVAIALGLGRFLRLGKGEERSGGRTKPSIMADAFEAIVAAVYLDGGLPAAWALIGRLLEKRIESVEFKGFSDFKTRLQETAQARLKATPLYRVIEEGGPDHDKKFVVAVSIGDQEWGRAIGKSKKEAEQQAAAAAHFRLETEAINRGE